MRKDVKDDFVDLEQRYEAGDEGFDDDNFEEESRDLPEWVRERKNAFLIGAGALVLLVFIAVIFSSGRGGNDPVTKNEFTALLLRVDRIESRVAQLDGLERAVADMIEARPGAADQSALINRLDVLAKKVDSLQQSLSSLSRETESLKAAAPAATAAPDRQASPRYHTVQRGETLFGIARSYNVDLNRLVAVNGIDRQEPIRVGQRLTIPAR